MKRLVFFILFALSGSTLFSADSLSLETFRNIVREQHPLLLEENLHKSIALLNTQNLKSENKPSLRLGARASWQSDVITFPIDNPLLDIPEIPQDQYQFTAEINQRIYDGGALKARSLISKLEAATAAAQSELQLQEVDQLVAELYCNALLLEESIEVVRLNREDLSRRKRQVDAMVREGVALKSAANEVQIALIRLDQRAESMESDLKILKQLMALWMNREDSEFTVYMEQPETNDVSTRAEVSLFAAQRAQLQASENLLSVQARPKFEAFGQFGVGRPNPLNFFETDFQPFAILGVRAVWTPVNWGRLDNQRQKIALQTQILDTKEKAFIKGYEIRRHQRETESDKYQKMLARDQEIIELQKSIVKSSEAQMKNGVITIAEYLSQVDKLNQAELDLRLHQVQSWKALQLAQL